jgi:hypothetical protein
MPNHHGLVGCLILATLASCTHTDLFDRGHLPAVSVADELERVAHLVDYLVTDAPLAPDPDQ